MLKAVIFDLDGLLVDSSPLQQEAMRIFIESFGKVYLWPKSGFEGMRIIDIIREYKDIFDLQGTVEELYEKRQSIYFELAKNQLELFPEAMELVTKLKKQGIKLALATSADKAYVDIIFKKFPELAQRFSAVVTSEEVLRGKPHPDVYKKVLDKLGINAKEAVVLEDSVNGVFSAKAAGIQVICVPNKNYPDADYSQADRVFDSLKEVITAIA